jgi:hypothetical protein
MQIGLDPGLMHRVAVIGAGTLDSLPHNGAVVTLLAACGSRHGEAIANRHDRDCRPDHLAYRRYRAGVRARFI